MTNVGVFNPNILDACIRDVASCLTNTQKVDLLLYSAPSIRIDSYTRVIVENAVHSSLQISTLSPEKIAKARIIRAKARLSAGLQFSANEDLQAALVAEPDNPEAAALLHQRSVSVEKLLSPLPRCRDRLSNEIWAEIVSYLPRKDLKSLLFVPHIISRLASQLLFKELDLHFGTIDHDADPWGHSSTPVEDDVRHARRTADILTRIIIDNKFASGVRTLKIFAPPSDKKCAIAFQTGILANALPNLTNLRYVPIYAGNACIVSILQVLQTTSPQLRGISLRSSDGPVDLSLLSFRHLAHFSYHADGGSQAAVCKVMAQNLTSLQTLSIQNKNWTFPSGAIAIRNFAHIDFCGLLPAKSQVLADILTHGRQLECLTLSFSIDCASSSQIFRSMSRALPFLRHFAFTVRSVSSRMRDPDLFPSIAEFLRGRHQLQGLGLVVYDRDVHTIVGFDAAIWGVLPSLVNLRRLEITYPPDLAPGLASWLIPRSVRALSLTLDYPGAPLGNNIRDPILFLDQLRPGIPPNLRYIRLPRVLTHNAALVVEHGFPTVRVVHIENNYWTVQRHKTKDLTSGHQDTVVLEMEQWPRSRAAHNATEWLEWLGCEDAIVSNQDTTFLA